MDKLKHLLNHLRQLPQHVWQRLKHKEQTVENNQAPVMYTEEQLMARLKFFIGICLSLTLFGIVFVVLYSLIFVTQPLNAISPIDQKFFELIVPIATFLTGTLSGIMLAGGDKDAQKQALAAANKGWDKPPTPVAPAPTTPAMGGFGSTPTFGSAPAPVANAFGAQPLGGGVGSSSGFGAPTGRVEPVFNGFAQPIAMTASGKKIVPEEPQPEL
jgi:hypothetical protein